MKKKYLTYIFITLVILFCNLVDVKAASNPFTCYYDTDNETIAIIQDEDNKLTAYRNASKGAGFDSEGWEKEQKTLNIENYNLQCTGAGQTLNCPEYRRACAASITVKDDSYVLYYKKDGKYKLREQKAGSKLFSKGVTDNSKTEEKNDSTISNMTCEDVKKNNIWLRELDSSRYEGRCLYLKQVGSNCEAIQIDIGKDVSGFGKYKNVDNTFSAEKIKSVYSGECPSSIYASFYTFKTYPDGCNTGSSQTAHCVPTSTTDIYEIGLSINEFNNKANAKKYFLFNTDGNNIVTDEKLKEAADASSVITSNKVTLDCDALFKDKEGKENIIFKLLKTIINLVKIFVPIALVGFGILDISKAVFAGDEDKMRKAQRKLIQRIIIGICIFLIPTLIKVILTIANSVWSNIDPDFCGIL